MDLESKYFDTARSAAHVEAGRHRNLVGGLWEELGAKQIEFLQERGLKPHHKLLDVGCGSLRGGVHFVGYLDSGNYFGVDISPELLAAGYDVELGAAGLQQRLPRENLRATGEFEIDGFNTRFDFAIAQSLFTHLTLNRIRQCLERLAPAVNPGGVFYATFFERPADAPASFPIRHTPGDVLTHGERDPYHYGVADFEYAAHKLPWRVCYIGAWDHPRGQRMLAFVREGADATIAPRGQRDLSADDATGLKAGADHYRAYVGPPNRFDFMSATQFSLLFANGLRERHRVLDFGCGSLRLGRLLIPFLREDGYFGIEPNKWLIDDGIARELGADAIRLKRPSFSYRDDFDCTVFGMAFDFIMAQSIVTHCGPDLFRKLMGSIAKALAPDGLALFSYRRVMEPNPEAPADGWHYPGCPSYTKDDVSAFLNEVGLVGTPIPWFHPGAAWHLAARSAERLPKQEEKRFLKGAVLFDPQFAASRRTQNAVSSPRSGLRA